MNGQPLPGFYWDAEKKKYFSIASARGMDLKYSAANIRKEEKKAVVQRVATAHSKRVRKERVVRLKPHSFAQTHIEREIGVKRRSYMQIMWPDACASGINVKPQQVLPSQDRIRLFDRDPISNTVFAVQGSNSVLKKRFHRDQVPSSPSITGDDSEPSFADQYSFHPWDEVTRTTSDVASLAYLPTSGALAVTSQGSDRPPEIFLTDPGRDEPYIGQKFTPRQGTTIWGAAARPASFSPSPHHPNSVAASQTEHLGVAISSSLQLLTRAQSGTWDVDPVRQQVDSDVLALEWTSHSTVIFGCRNGKIHLYDTRLGRSHHILTHPYPISKLKRADDETRLVCSGLRNSVFLYDIRSPRLSRTSSRSSFNYDDHHYNENFFKALFPRKENATKRRKLNHQAFKNWSQPVLTFAHANQDLLYLDIDVHPRLGLLAAGQDTTTDIGIRISNVWTGRTVKEISRRVDDRDYRNVSEHWKANVTLKFIDRDEEDGAVDLWSCWNGGIVNFSW